MLPYRAGIVWLASTVVLMAIFLIFAYGTGWPAFVDSCWDEGKCYCERIDIDAVRAGATGIRQPVNTWFNLYAILTSVLVAIFMGVDRARGNARNVIQSSWWVADAYVFAVLFLGLGSMWFHASISKAVAWMDGLSMYVFAAYLVFYTLDRGLARRNSSASLRRYLFLLGYPGLVILCTVLGQLGINSVVLIFTLVLAYVLFEFLYAGFIWDQAAIIFWLTGLFAMENAIVFWVLSQTGKPLCDPDAFFQPHGILWHPLAGVMAVMMYFYWRQEAGGAAVQRTATVAGAGTSTDSSDGWR